MTVTQGTLRALLISKGWFGVNTAWTAKAYSLFDTLLWIACLNLLWLGFTLGGLVIFGAGPSTIAAHELVRRRVQGDVAPLARAFWETYRRSFIRGNILGVTAIFVGTMLFVNWKYFSVELTFTAQLISVVVAFVSIIFAATICYLFPMYVRYQLPILQYFLQSSRFALRYLAGTVLLLFVTVAVGYVSMLLPGLIPFFSIGVWIFLVGWLCEKFFTANDKTMADAAGATTAPVHPSAAMASQKELINRG